MWLSKHYELTETEITMGETTKLYKSFVRKPNASRSDGWPRSIWVWVVGCSWIMLPLMHEQRSRQDSIYVILLGATFKPSFPLSSVLPT
jgi:hypothetical protein